MYLYKNERFQKEYDEFSKKISKINNATIKTELLSLLKNLVNEVKKLDHAHLEIFHKQKIGGLLEQQRENLYSIRKQIAKKLEDCEKAGLIKD